MFRAVMLEQVDDRVEASIQQLDDDQLPPGDVTVDIEWSTVNYKDGLAYRGAPGVVRAYPIVPGVDLAGVVAESTDDRWQVGDRVVVNGWRLGERHWGGHAERARVSGDWLTRLPASIDTRTAMVIGTAGYTAMLCVLALERNELRPDAGTVVVTGASGGVGSVAVSLLSHLGYHVAAVTGRTSEADYLRELGAAEIVDRADLTGPARPLASVRWAGGVDAVGGEILANILAATAYGGVVAACGLAASMDLPTSVAPFILRAVTLAGVESVEAPQHLRDEAWARLATDLDPAQIRAMTTEVALGDLPGVAAEILAGRVRGRVVVDVRR
ncbi:MAG TPA: MDR family oxidoreductase [Acidimicrobiales bacterium]|nr:MDR family oxidoreductase [Acidimicrobiales bacterium]